MWGILVAAGSGSRFGGAKQFEIVGGKPVLQWSLDALQAVVDGVVVVLPPDDVHCWSGPHAAVAGGASRSESVRNGLEKVPADAEIVLVHDAARPFATASLGRAVAQAVADGADAAIPGVPVSDTIKRVDRSNSRVLATIDRSDLYAVQTPQAFRAESLRKAHVSEPDASDDATLVENIGGMVVVVPGEYKNMKITVASDLAIAQILAEKQVTSHD